MRKSTVKFKKPIPRGITPEDTTAMVAGILILTHVVLGPVEAGVEKNMNYLKKYFRRRFAEENKGKKK